MGARDANDYTVIMSRLDYSQAALDYDRIEKAIAYLTANHLEQPHLPAIARAAHLSEFHFQKVFTRWAGISPKRFLQFLTLEHAKVQLTSSKALLDAAIESGLSGPGRLHDLFVSIEAVTPGEFRTRGAGITIQPSGLHVLCQVSRQGGPRQLEFRTLCQPNAFS